jgi:hypothetical protein
MQFQTRRFGFTWIRRIIHCKYPNTNTKRIVFSSRLILDTIQTLHVPFA